MGMLREATRIYCKTDRDRLTIKAYSAKKKRRPKRRLFHANKKSKKHQKK